MSAISIQLADAIASDINGHTWLAQPESFSAVRKYYAVYQDDDLATMKVSVVAVKHRDTRATREKLQGELTFFVDVQKMLTDFSSVSEMDGFVNFLAEMLTFFRDEHRFGSPLEDWWIQDAEYVDDAFWGPDELYYQHRFEAAIKLTVQGQHT